jgi:hypothetical protein
MMMCNFTNEIIYGSTINDMLNYTEGIINRMKGVNFFDAYVQAVKPLVNLLIKDSPTNQKLPTSIFSTNVFCL